MAGTEDNDQRAYGLVQDKETFSDAGQNPECIRFFEEGRKPSANSSRLEKRGSLGSSER